MIRSAGKTLNTILNNYTSCRAFCQGKMSAARKRPKRNDDTKEKRIVWVDLEMSGLDVEKEHILEMACLITDSNLNVVAESEDIIINQPAEVLNNMGDWCKKHHGKSGLTAAVLSSQVSLQEAEDRMVKFLREHSAAGVCPLAGNTVYMDRMFLMKYMPTFTAHLHYRIIDVSTVKELCRRWYPEKLKDAPKKKLSHRALDDIRESIEELKYYQNAIFIPT